MRTLVRLAPLLFALWIQGSTAQAQTTEAKGALADAWVDATLREEAWLTVYGRYVAAPAAAVLGGLLLAAPPFADLPPGSTAAYMTSGGLMLTAAIGAWALPDPFAARHWLAGWGDLGFVALGTGLILSCTERSCQNSELMIASGAVTAGFFLSAFVVSLVAQQPSPRALQLEVRGLGPARRHARVLAFLEQRERTRRIGSYVALAWGLALGVGALVSATQVSTPEARALLYGSGGLMLALTAGLLIFEVLHEPDPQRFLAGKRPD